MQPLVCSTMACPSSSASASTNWSVAQQCERAGREPRNGSTGISAVHSSDLPGVLGATGRELIALVAGERPRLRPRWERAGRGRC